MAPYRPCDPKINGNRKCDIKSGSDYSESLFGIPFKAVNWKSVVEGR